MPPAASPRVAPRALLLAAFAAGPLAGAVTWSELESFLPLREGGAAPRAVPVTWVVGFPDTLAGTDTRAILASLAPGKGQPLLPRGTLDRREEDFVTGLRAFADGNAARAAEAWGRLHGQALAPELAAALRVNLGVLLALRGEARRAEQGWLDEWRRGTPAAEGGWRNAVTLRMAQGRWSEAGAIIDAMLAARPRHRLALLAKAALLWQVRPESEWLAFLAARAAEDSAVADMQLLYAEQLLKRARPSDLEEAVLYFDKGLEKLPGAGRGWYLLAEAQFRQGYYYFALDCLQNAGRAGYAEADFHELYARVLHACCTGDEDPRAAKARAAAQELLEKSLAKDLHRRAAAQLLYTLYAQNLKPDAARELEKNLWFHFEGPRRDVPRLGELAWRPRGLEARGLRVKFGLYDLYWILALRETDVYRGL